MVAGQDLEQSVPLRVRAGDQVLDHAELHQRPPDLLQRRRRNPVRVPVGLDQPLQPDLLRLNHLRPGQSDEQPHTGHPTETNPRLTVARSTLRAPRAACSDLLFWTSALAYPPMSDVFCYKDGREMPRR